MMIKTMDISQDLFEILAPLWTALGEIVQYLLFQSLQATNKLEQLENEQM